MDHQYSVFVNTSDGFQDCWKPFFILFRKYWPECQAPIFLNTERKSWVYIGLELHCTTVQANEAERLTWSECLIAGLKQVKTPLVLYFQEDYFIHQHVRDDLIQRAANYMMDHPAVKHIGLTRHGSLGPYEPAAEEWLQTIPQHARYRISTQAGLWRVDTLLSYLRPEENGWMFEIYGTWRARRRHETFLCIKTDAVHGGPGIDYLHTGIIKGKWLRAIQPVFERHGIEVDYEKRGFYQPKPGILHKLDVGRRLLSRPGYLIRQLF